MSFVKLDTGLLHSSLWVERNQRSLFVTALLMADPFEVREPMNQIEVRSLDHTGWKVPPGWYGLVRAAGVGIVRQDGLDSEEGLAALEVLGAPDPESRSQDFEGRRLARVDGGYLVLNYMKYRDRDHTAAERQQRLRDRRKASQGNGVMSTGNAVTDRNVTPTSRIAESREQKAEVTKITAPKTLGAASAPKKKGGLPPYDALFEEAWALYPPKPKNTKTAAWRQWLARTAEGVDPIILLAGTKGYADYVQREGTEPRFVKLAATFYGRDRHFEASFAPVDHTPSEDDLLRKATPEQRHRIARIESILAEDAAEEARSG